jgi:outer membrane protein OmpA-like peptidoglycan-associated protein
MHSAIHPRVFLAVAGIFMVIVLTECAKKSAAMSQSALALKVALESQQNALIMLDRVSENANQADSSRQINHETNVDIQNYVNAERKKIQEITQKLEAAQNDIRDFDHHKSDKKEAEILANASRMVFESAEILRILEEKTKVIVDFLGSETFSKSEIGALFRPGEYKLIREQQREGTRLFGPVVEKLYVFANKYKNAFTSLKGQIIVTGYSDATAVETGSALYRDLASRLAQLENITEPGQPDLNRKLSELRADAVRQLLERIIADRKKDHPDLIDITVQTLGRGEELPPGLTEEVLKNDRRRRVVTFYWVVLPNM